MIITVIVMVIECNWTFSIKIVVDLDHRLNVSGY